MVALRRRGHRCRDVRLPRLAGAGGGIPPGELLRPVRRAWTDLLLTLAVTVIGGALAVGGTIALAPVFFADPRAADAMLFQPLPMWAAVLAVVVFPISVALTELPVFFGYAQPRVANLTRSASAGVLVAALLLSLQHTTLPLIFDAAFLGWRALMFLGFALVLSWVLWKRPRLLPYLIVVHFFLDLQAAVSILLASSG